MLSEHFRERALAIGERVHRTACMLEYAQPKVSQTPLVGFILVMRAMSQTTTTEQYGQVSTFMTRMQTAPHGDDRIVQ